MYTDIGSLCSRTGEELVKMWRVKLPPRERTLRKHSHTLFEVMMVLNGSGIYTTNSGDLPIQQGDVFVFSSNEFHCITEVSNEGLEIVNLHFEPRFFLSDSASFFDSSYHFFCFSHAKAFENRIEAPNAEALRYSMISIEKELTQQQQARSLAIRAQLNILAVSLVRECGYLEEKPASTPQMDCIMNAMYYIEEHLSESLSLTDIANYSGTSPNYFSTLFKKICNVSLWDYITTKRIEKAIRMICSDNCGTMLDVAMACGFNNTANFNKAFRKQTGLTPTQYRNADILTIHQ